MLSEVSAREMSQWQAYSRHRAEQSEKERDGSGAAATRKAKQAKQREERAEAAEALEVAGGGEVSRGPNEPPPDVSPEGVEFPPAALWEPPVK